MRKHFALLLLIACLCAPLGGCVGSTPAPNSAGANATYAVNARAAIDGIEALHATTCAWAVEQHVNHKMDEARYAKFTKTCDAVAAAETEANTQLQAYLATGSLDTRQAMDAAVDGLKLLLNKLLAMKGG